MRVYTRKQSAHRLRMLLGFVATSLAAHTNVGDWNIVKALTAGTQVQISIGSVTVRGEIERSTDDVLVVASSKGQEMFDREQISRVSVKKPRHHKRNTLIGLGVGAGVGLAVGIATRPSSGQWEIISPDVVVAGLVGAGAIGGTLVGVVLPTGGWREIYKK